MKKISPSKEALQQELQTLRQRVADLESSDTRVRKPGHTLQGGSEEWEQAFHALTDHVMILDRSGIILWANKAVCERFEPIHGNVIGMNYRLPYYGTTQLETPPPWETVLAGALSAVMETWLSTLGGWFLVSCYPLFDNEGKQWGAISVVKDITDRKRVEEALRNIAQGAPAAGSVAFFRSLVKDLSNALGIEYAVLAEYAGSGKTHVQTVAVCSQGEFVDNFTWHLPENPSTRLLTSRVCTWSNTAQTDFPGDPLITKWNVTSYLASPLLGSTGQVIGLILAMDRNPLANVHVAESILRLFAVRAASELERKRAEEALRDSEERFRAIVENAYDLIFESNPTGQFLYLSPNCLEGARVSGQ